MAVMTIRPLSLTPFLVKVQNGALVAADWGRVFVPENRTSPNGNTIEVPFVRFKSKAKHPSAPLFFLNGGPGDVPTTLDSLEQLVPLVVEPFTDTSDVVLVEQRGIGHSRPRLDCPGAYRLPLDKPLDRETAVAITRSYFAGCAKFWEDRGVDLSGYNVREMAADVDAIRHALGYTKITLFGGSFGSHHCIAVLKQFGEHIDRAVLTSLEGPNHTIKLPSVVQGHLEVLDDMVKADSELSQYVPDFIGLVRAVLDSLSERPVTVEVTDPETGERLPVTVGRLDLQLLTSNAIGRIDLRALPAHYYAMSQGDFSWLAQRALSDRSHSGSNIMPLAVDCASGATEERRAQIRSEADGTLLGDAINGTGPLICDAVGSPDLGDAFRAPLESDVPVLSISGELDARTPVSNAEEILPGLVNGQRLIVEGASHSMWQEAWPQILPVIVRFVKGDPFEQLTPARIAAPFELERI